VVVPFAARGLKRQKFLLKVAVYCVRRQSHGHEVAPQLIRHFNLDELINRRVKSVKRRILISPAAKDIWKFTGVTVTCIQSQQINLESRAVSKCVCSRQSAYTKCVDPTLPLAHGVEMVTGFETLNLEQNVPLADSFVI
jgi:hypothetical protein